MDEFRIDFAKINLLELRNLRISTRDIYDLFKMANSEIIDLYTDLYVIGYVNEIKFIHVSYNISKNVNFDIEVINTGIPNEKQIKKYWCEHRKRN